MSEAPPPGAASRLARALPGVVLREQGAAPLIVGAIGEVVIAVATLGMVIGADRLFGLG